MPDISKALVVESIHKPLLTNNMYPGFVSKNCVDNVSNYDAVQSSRSGAVSGSPNEGVDIIMNPLAFEGDIAVYYEDIKSQYSVELADKLKKYGQIVQGVRPNSQSDKDDDIEGLDILVNNRWTKRGTNGKVLIPYRFNEGGFTNTHMNTIRQAMNMIEQTGVVQYIPWVEDDVDYLWIYGEPTGGCWSYIGRTGGWQTVHLQTNGCVYVGIIAHELMHALGFWHEHTRVDRDEYVRINTDRIKSGTSNNFQKRSESEANDLGFGYDYGSVMHYSKTSFSTGGNTIDTIDENGLVTNQAVGQRNGPSSVDLRQITLLYMCPNFPRNSVPDGKDFCNDECPCWEGKGDCDSDIQCQGDLVCEYGNSDNEVCRQLKDRCSVNKPCAVGLEGCVNDDGCINNSVCIAGVCTAAITQSPTQSPITPPPTLRSHRGWKKRRNRLNKG